MELFWISVAGLIVVVGPWKAGIVFGERTRPMPLATRYATAFYAVGISWSVGMAFILAGDAVLAFFHISEAAFLVGAGLILIVFSIRMVISEDEVENVPPAESADEARALHLAAYPLAVPLVITPPGIAALVSLGAIAATDGTTLLPVVAAFSAVMLLNLAAFAFLGRFEDRLSSVFFHVSARLLGVLLVAFGVSVLIDGLRIMKVVKS